MTLTQMLSACAVTALVSVAMTRYYFPSIQIKTIETTKEVVKADIQTVTHTVTQPGGVVETTVTTTDHSQRTEVLQSSTVVAKHSTLNVSALVANGLNRDDYKMIYGLTVSKEIVGPITVGLFGLTNSTLGVSVGLNF